MENYLSDPAYIGKYKLYRKNVYLDNYIPRLMSDKLFYDVQKLKSKKTIVRKNTYEDLFSGLIYCPCCNSRMCKKVDNRVKNILVRYICDQSSKYKVGSCEKKCKNNKTIRENIIEQYLLDNLDREAIKFKTNTKTYEKITKNKNPQKIKDIENKILRLKDLYLDDLIDKEIYKEDYKKLQEEKEMLQKQQETIKIKKDYSYLDAIVNSDYKKSYFKLTAPNKKRFWLSIVDKIYIENGKIKEVTFL